MSDAVLKKFGKYFLLDRVGEGGMAEIFRARLANLDAAGRLLVIKRIQAAYNNNTEFVNMFKAEVQVTMRFNHPNIVQLYEAGEESGQQFIAMELVDGKNLRQILSRAAHKQQRIPAAMVCSIIENAAAGLHYAHSFRDRITGEPLHLVHRDVSPQNILVSFDGNIKVIDFGIAKATTNSEATRAGVIKGKLSYLSPEQVMGESLDARSDIFALGIVFWEMLTGKRLFVAEGENEFQVLKMIESCNTFVKPPSVFNPEVSAELDQIVLSALTRDPNKRYTTADDLARALRKFLVTQYPEYQVSDLSAFVKKMFHEHIVEDRKNLQEYNARAEELLKMGLHSNPNFSNESSLNALGDGFMQEHTRMTETMNRKPESSSVFERMSTPEAASPQPAHQVRISAQQKPMLMPNHKTSSYTPPRPVVVKRKSRGLGKWVVAATLSGVALFGGYQYLQQQKISFDQLPSVIAQLTKLQGDVLSRMPNSVETSEKVPDKTPDKTSLAPQAELKLEVLPQGGNSQTKIWVNGQEIDPFHAQVKVTLGELIDVRVERNGYEHHQKEFTVLESDLDSSKAYTLQVKLDPMKYGTLTLSTRPPVATVQLVKVNGSSRNPSGEAHLLQLKTPLSHEKIEPGTYRMTLTNDLLKLESSQLIQIREGKNTTLVDVMLKSKR